MTAICKLTAHSHAGCPECGHRVAFFRGQEGAFMSEERSFPRDIVLELNCPAHGMFKLRADEFRTEATA